MASKENFVEFVVDQSGLSDRLSYRRMFGEYALYLDGKVVALVCDNQLFLKPTEAARSLLGSPTEAPPYPGAKNYFRLDEEIESRQTLRSVLELTASALPAPKPKASAAKRAAKRAGKRTGKAPRKRPGPKGAG